MNDERLQQPGVGPTGGAMPALKVLLYLVAVFIAMLAVGILTFPVLLLGGADIKSLGGPETPMWVFAVEYVPIAVIVVVITLGFVAFLDRRPVGTLGFAREGTWRSEIWLGVGLGFALPLLMLLICYATGWTKITAWPILRAPGQTMQALVLSVVVMTGVAVTEETVIRGYILQTLRSGYGVVVALLFSSLVFGAGHFMNPEWGLPGFLGTAAAGLVLGYAYLATRRLWLPVAFHFAWNLALGPVLGFPVSGMPISAWVQQEFTGPALWTGGGFGPEAGLLGLAALIPAGIAIWWFSKTRYRQAVADPEPTPTEEDKL